MKNTVFILMTLLALPAVAETETLKHNANFFANSLRRDADQEEASSIVRTGNGCTGFFVANKNNRLLVASARHCFDYQATTNCASGSIHLVTARGTHALTCSSLVVSRADNDMFIMEVKPDSVGVDAVLKDISFLKLSAKKPADGQRLKMIGYPVDPERKGVLTTTVNCASHQGSKFSNEALTPEEFEALSQRRRQNPTPELDRRWAEVKTFRGAFHDCTVYGGNSGGPLVENRTGVVFGMPSVYLPEIFRKFEAGFGTYMETTADFIQMNEEAILLNKIAVINPYAI